MLLTVWEAEPPGEEDGTPFVWGAVAEDIVEDFGRDGDLMERLLGRVKFVMAQYASAEAESGGSVLA